MHGSAVRTFLEMRERSALRPARLADPSIRIEQVHDCPASFWRYLYTEVGRDHHWIDRLPWTDDAIRRYLDGPGTTLWVMWIRGAPAGYFELNADSSGGVEIAYFGLLKAYTGRRLGGPLLTEAVERAWATGASRVWVHTSTLDHPAALPNYLKRGFKAFHSETYQPGGSSTVV